ncbi:MAG: type I-MYXAN CRISPR-associated protein Cmx8 [candidate division WOR-3 bacterium]|nr:type I-MYXAN CRISPR-associated protein Cmx8 [candidate division WOR-3 bacterium]
MAKTKRKAAPEPEVLELKYDLYSLPTAQHKAGLAGLLLMVESMKARKLAPLPVIADLTSTGASVTFSRKSMQAMFDDLFDAYWSEEERLQKLKRKDGSVIPFKREVSRDVTDRDGKTKTKKYYVYDMFHPAGKFLAAYYPDGDGVWLKLWRDMLWKVLRKKPASRKVYEERAGERDKNGRPSRPAPSSKAGDWWKQLHKALAARVRGGVLTDSIASSVFIGAQNVNAERVPYQGTVEYCFLLNFWSVVALVYVPRRTKADGENEDIGHVVVIPEPADIRTFVGDLVGEPKSGTHGMLGSLETAVAGYLPKAALINTPGEGGLEYLHHLIHHRISRGPLSSSLAAVEAYHVTSDERSASLLASVRVLPDETVLRDYEILRQQCRNPLFRAQRIRNLLAGTPWHAGMDAVFGAHPREFFVRGDKTPRIPFFGSDARSKFRAIESQLKQIGGQPMTLRAYVRIRAEDKSKVKSKNARDEKGRITSKDFADAVERVCSDAFLAMRGRRDNDLIEYFTGTICSVPQFLPEDDYMLVSKALTEDWSKVKTLAMLAVSACSYTGKSQDE